MNKIATIPSIRLYNVSQYGLNYSTLNNEIYLNNQRLAHNASVPAYFIKENLIVYGIDNGKGNFIFDIKQNTLLEIGFISSIVSFSKNTIAYLYEPEAFTRKLIMFDLENPKNITIISDDNDLTYRIILEDKIFCNKKRNLIIAISYEGKDLFTFDTFSLPTYLYQGGPKKDEINKFIGLSGKLLWLTTKGNRIISLNADSGELVNYLDWKIEEGEFFVPRSSEASLNENKTHIFILSAYFVVINALNGKIELKLKVKDFFNSLANHVVVNTKLQGQYISFSASAEHSGIVKYIGLFNILNYQLDWFYEMEFNDKTFIPAGQVPQLAGDKLYILDSGHTLHIFEKEALPENK